MVQPLNANNNHLSSNYGVFGQLSDIVTLDQPFPDGLSKYITVGVGGDIVYENADGEMQFIPNVLDGAILPIVAKRIVGAANVRTFPRVTSASSLGWIGGF